MRNLHCVGHFDHHLDLAPEFGLAAWVTIDHDTGHFYVAGTGMQVACFTCGDAKLSWCVDLVQEAARCGTDLPPHAAVTACAHAPDLEAVFIALSTGELLLLRPSAPSLPAVAVEEVGRVAGGVAAAAWSPDGEVLAVVGCAGQLLLMSSGWELLSEGPVACNAPAFPQPTAGPGPAAGEGEGGAPALVPGEVAVSWRGDAKFFATATVDGFGAAPRVRVWDGASGELHALGEAAEGLQAVLGWQPNGRHLYAAQFLPRAAAAEAAPAAADADGDGDAGGATQDQAAQQPRGAQGQAPEVRHVGAWKRELRRQRAAAAAAGAGAAPARVLLFERNGLQHGGFDVAGQGGAVQALHWSPDSELLAAVLVHPAAAVAAGAGGCDGGPPASQRTLQLWHRSNWRWYLAYERRFVDCAGLHVCWDEGGGGSGGGGGGGLHIVTAEGGYSHARLARAACVSALGTAAVVDGASVLLTPLRLAVTPPPMAAAALALPAPAACLALRDAGGGGDGGSGDEAVAAVLSDGRLAVLRCCEGDLWEETLEEQLEQAAWAGAGPPRLLPRVLGRRGAGAAAAARQAAWASPTSLLLVEPSEGGDRLVEVEVFAGGEAGPAECAGAGADVAAEVWAAPAPGPVVRCVSRAEAPGAVVQVAGGALWVYHPGGRLEPAAERLPCACPLMAATPAAARRADSAAPEAFGLDPRGRLFWGAAQVAAGVTSFALLHHAAGGPFLLYTSRDHTLRTLPLAALRGGRAAPRPAPAAPAPWQQQPGAGPPPPPPPGDISVRPVEEGSLLVAAPSGGIDVICQAPRGNLESVRPRALALPALAAELDAGRFAAAWALAAANRLDLNVLVDHRWPRFLTQASQFAREVGSDLALAELLAALTPGSTAAEGGIYAGALPSGPAHTHTHSGAAGAGGAPADGHSEVLAWRAGGAPAAAAPAAAAPAAAEAAAAKAAAAEAAAAQGKVEAVCAAVRAAAEALEAEDPSAGRRWFRARLTSLSRCGDLEGALRLVQAAKEADLAAGGGGGGGAAAGAAGTGGAAGGGPTAEEGLRHLLLHAPEEGVYRAALGSYCLELAYMVVAHSQRDPGEYLLELQRFAAVPCPHLRAHAIDAHLGRHASALRHLAAAGPAHFAAALAHARRHGLLRALLALTEGADRAHDRARVHAACGEELEGRAKHEDAALAFMAAGDGERALRSYRLAGLWRPALALAARLGRAPDRVAAMAARLAADLADTHQQADAAAVTLHYLDDVPAAVRLLGEGGEWREAVRVACARGRGDLVDSAVAPAAAAAAARMAEGAAEDAARVAKYTARLAELRGRRAAVAAAVAAADEGADLRWRGDEEGTEAGSAVTGMSVYADGSTTLGGGSGASGASASTLGGKRGGAGAGAGKKRAKSERRRPQGRARVRQGSPEEEAALAGHLLALAPLASVCAEAGQLAEALVWVGREGEAAALQRALAALAAAQAAAAADVLAHPPPGQGLAVGEAARRQAAAGGGAPAVAALEAAAAGVAGGELQRRAAEGAAAVGGAHWKWDILREA